MAIAQANGAALEELKVQMLNRLWHAGARKDNRMYRTYALLSAENAGKISYLLKKALRCIGKKRRSLNSWKER